MFPNKLNSKGGPSTDNTGAKAPKAIGPSTISCPDHLKIADLTVAKSLGPAKKCAVKIVGRKMCREKGERVHICTRCDFPIAIYGRLPWLKPQELLDFLGFISERGSLKEVAVKHRR
ncbi:hypothetical protein ACET3Z_008422 [Daucus carota]